jgi:hypothetical protein
MVFLHSTLHLGLSTPATVCFRCLVRIANEPTRLAYVRDMAEVGEWGHLDSVPFYYCVFDYLVGLRTRVKPSGRGHACSARRDPTSRYPLPGAPHHHPPFCREGQADRRMHVARLQITVCVRTVNMTVKVLEQIACCIYSCAPRCSMPGKVLLYALALIFAGTTDAFPFSADDGCPSGRTSECKYTHACCPGNFVCGPGACCPANEPITCPNNSCCAKGSHC